MSNDLCIYIVTFSVSYKTEYGFM